MDVIPAAFDIENRLAERQAAETRPPGALGREAFLELLITQLSNQDPLSPLQDHEFVSQLATFSSLEQLENLNEAMQASILMDQSVNNSLATTLIGKEVLAEGSAIHLGEEGSLTFELQLGGEANAQILIRDASGTLVRQISRSALSPGGNEIVWDGRTNAGERAPAGDYTVEAIASDSDGNPVESLAMVRAEVTGVRFFEGIGFLMLGDTALPLSSVVEVFGPSGG
jgi:flagellar basal-body rod modification protein FlgD